MAGIPERPTLDALESRWDAEWERTGTYRFDRTAPREQVFSIDTPPPTVSGSLHLGSFFGYVQTDSMARYRRMSGKAVFYPMGWDDNGLPTERRVQNHYNVRCDPTVAFDPQMGADPERFPDKHARPISRRNFVALCLTLTARDEKVFEDVWRHAGLSVDWQLTYATIGAPAQRAAQRAFLRSLARGEAWSREAPTLWDVDFRTAVAQAELEDRETPGAYHRMHFARPDGTVLEVDTTRPELLPSCVALVAHPDDERYQPLFGTQVTTPLFDVPVTVHPHPLAEPGKGTGIAMVCTFGDTTDVTWWRELDLPVRSVIGRDGRLAVDTPDWITPGGPAGAYAELAGKTSKQAQKRIAELLAETGLMTGDPKPITHPVKYYEKGDRPLEVVTSRQWYIRNGASTPELRDALLARGRELTWHPPHMRVRYEHWVEGLNTDWLISRQRYFGVPFPVWYPVDASGEAQWDSPLLPEESQLPVDPSSDVPAGFDEHQRGVPGGFVGDPDVMDTWATSSLTPQIACGWADDDDLFARTYPMDLRPQGPEIIRTWLFATVLRSHLEHDRLPWAHASINGWVLDPDRKKMSKSLGNVVTPVELLEQYGADGVRYWACSGAPGTDTAADQGQMKVGRRLANKVLNATKFALGIRTDDDGQPLPPLRDPALVTADLDRALLADLARVIEAATTSFEAFEYQRALEVTEAFFWRFCDAYVELVKTRAYGSGPAAESAQAAVGVTLDAVVRLLAPFLPFVTEEVWSWFGEGSVHRAAWPTADALGTTDGEPAVLTAVAAVLADVRRTKSQAKLTLRTPVTRLVVADGEATLALLRRGEVDLRNAGVVQELVLEPAAERSVRVQLAEPEPAPAGRP